MKMTLALDWPHTGRNCFEFRLGIEGEAAAAAASHHTPEDLVNIAQAMQALESSSAAARNSGLQEDLAFHLCIARASRNAYFVTTLMSMRDAILEGMLLSRTRSGLRISEKISAINGQHRLIYEAIVEGDAERSRTAMRMHLTRCEQSTAHWYNVSV